MRNPRALQTQALRWLAQREHSCAEMRAKLLRLSAERADADLSPSSEEDPSQRVDQVLQWLQSRGYLSDQRFVEVRVHARQARFGNRRIEQELARHQLSLNPAAAQELAASELSRARTVWHSRFDAPAGDARDRARHMRFLLQRGFSPEIVRQVLDGVARDGGSAPAASDWGEDRE